MQKAIVNRTGRPDEFGRILLDWPHLVHDGETHWLCLEEGQPEPEVLVVTNVFGQRVGVPTGRQRPCAMPR